MTATVYEFPREWYQFTRVSYRIMSRSQSASRPWIGGKSVYGPHAQFWAGQFSMTTQTDRRQRQEIAAFFSRLRGQTGLLRISDWNQMKPWRDRDLAAGSQAFSDASLFTDGTGFEDGALPPDLYVVEAALRGSRYLILGGLPVSTAECFIPGDRFQIKPNGIAGSVPHLYEMMIGGASDADGNIGVQIEPPLRTDVAAGDQVSLRYPSTVFRLIDDNQGSMEVSWPGRGDIGFSVIEALDMVT